MLKNYFITAFRNLTKNKTFSVINIIGLSIGIAACLFISIYVNYEKSYDQSIEKVDNLYRVLYERVSETGEKVQFASASPKVGPAIKEKIPEVLEFARMYKLEGVISKNNISFREEKMLWAEPNILDLFSYEIIQQSADSLLHNPNTLLLSEKAAKKYFGNQDPLNQTLTLDGMQEFKVVGVFKAKPKNMHYDADILLSYINWENQLGERLRLYGWMFSGFYTYVILEDGSDYTKVNQKIKNLVDQELAEFMEHYKLTISYQLQPVKDIHLTSHFMHELKSNGNKNSIIFLNIIAWFILVIAWINFINLLTISSIKRSSEIGLRKVLGGSSSQLIRQFLLESLLINSIALIFALLFIEILFPGFSRLTGVPQGYLVWNEIWFWRYTVIIFCVGTLLAGSYPIWGIISKKIIVTLRQGYSGSKKSVYLRQALLVFQFFMAVLLISGTISIYQQLQHLKSKETGINKSGILVMHTPKVGNQDIVAQRKAFKQEIKKFPFIRNISYSSVIPGKHNMFNRGGVRRINDENLAGKNYRLTEVDHNFTQVYSNIFISGRNFSDDYQADAESVIVNYAASELLGFEKPENAINEKIYIGGKIKTIIGVIENYHQESPRLEFEPQILRLPERYSGYFSVKYNQSANLETLRNTLEKKYQEFFPGNPFDFFYLEDFYANQYKSEVRFGQVFGLFSLLALSITLLGILSLSAFSANQRKKEIGIRKVLGANINQILVLLSKNYLLLLITAFVLSMPVIYYALEKWLNNFANKMEPTIWIFVIPVLLITMFSLLTVAYQSIKTAKDNPADSLRTE